VLLARTHSCLFSLFLVKKVCFTETSEPINRIIAALASNIFFFYNIQLKMRLLPGSYSQLSNLLFMIRSKILLIVGDKVIGL
jgi:hypothetical protein